MLAPFIPSSLKARHVRRLRADVDHIRTIQSYKKDFTMTETPTASPEVLQKLYTTTLKLALKKLEIWESAESPMIQFAETLVMGILGQENPTLQKKLKIANIFQDLAAAVQASLISDLIELSGHEPSEEERSEIAKGNARVVMLIGEGMDLLNEGLAEVGYPTIAK